MFLALLGLMAVGPLLPWRKASAAQLRNGLLLPLAAAGVTAGAIAALGVHKPLPLLAFGLAAGSAAGILREWWRGTQAQHARGHSYPGGFIALLLANRPRYGGYVAHLGIALLAVSTAASSFYSQQREVALAPGTSVEVGDYRLVYDGAEVTEYTDRTDFAATVRVFRSGRLLEILHPGFSFYPAFSTAAAHASIRSTPAEDLYIIANEFQRDGSALFRIHLNPLIMWMWVSGVLFMLGTVVSLWPERVALRMKQPAADRALAPAAAPSRGGR
jgi:cytochrome c-type biogenesis protein CcmF